MQSVLNFTGLICVFRKIRKKKLEETDSFYSVLFFPEVEVFFQWPEKKSFSASLTQQKLHFLLNS